MDLKTLNAMSTTPESKMGSAMAMERDAQRFRGEGKIEQAFQAFDQAARIYQEGGEYLKAAECFSSAATCWNIHAGWQPLRNAATRNELAGIQAVRAQDYAYAETLFMEAALLYDREGDFEKYSYCYIRAKDARLARLWRALTQSLATSQTEKTGKTIFFSKLFWPPRLRAFLSWFSSFLNRLIWGYGEQPFRTLGIAGGLILLSAFCYYFSGEILSGGFIQKIGWTESLYLSIMTYTTVGYGDSLPMGWVKNVAALEALAGIWLTPLFLIALSRRFLRFRR